MKDIPEYNLQMWPGYELTTKSVTHGIFLNIDTATKFVNKTTMLEYVEHLSYDKRLTNSDIEKMFSSSDPDNKRMTVMTEYNSKSYQIDGISF